MKVEDIFLAALDHKAPAQRKAYLNSACGEDAALRAQVEGLLRSHEEIGSFLAGPLYDSPPTFDQSASSSPPESDDGPGGLEFLAPSTKPGSLGRLGHYEVQEVIGRGGMGVVLGASDEKLHR